MIRLSYVGVLAAGLLLAVGLPRVMGPSAEVISAQGTLLTEGRVLETEDEIRMSFPGSQLRLASSSKSIGLNFDLTKFHPDSGIDVQINDGPWKYYPLGGRSHIDLSSDDDAEGMTINIIRRNEAWQGDLIFAGATSHGDFIKPAPFPKTKLLFIGDSITAGAGTESRINEAGEREAVSNARVAYPRVLGERLKAQVHHVAYGGRGVTRDWQGITDTNNAPQFYDRVLPDNPTHLWDPDDYQADIVSIMLGTNDFNPGIPDKESWTAAYRKFVSRVRTDYPEAQVFLISSPMTGGEKGEALKDYVRGVAESFETPQVKYLQVSQYYGEPWDSHPTAAEHQKIADELEPVFRAHLDD